MTSRSRTHRHRSTPQIAPRTNFFPTLPSSSSHVQRAHDPPFPFTCSTPPQPFEKLSFPLLPILEEVDAAGIPNCGFVFPRRYLLFHAGVHRMNEEGKLEGWTDDSPFSPLLLPFFLSLLLFLFYFPFPPLPSPRIPFECARSFSDRSPMMNGYWNKVMPVLMLRNVSKLGEYRFPPSLFHSKTLLFSPWSIKCSRKCSRNSTGIGYESRLFDEV